MPHRFHIVDVFAESLHAGNTLAVVRDAADLDGEAMQRIAREFGFSETTFLVGPPDARGTRVRIFTPAEELPFAGHPTLGTAWVIREHLLPERPREVALQLGVGAVPVAFAPEDGGAEVAWLTAPSVTLGRRLDAARLAPALGLELADFSATLPVQHVHAGVQFVFAPLASEAAVARARFDLAAFAPLAREGLPPYVYVFAPAAADDLSVRLFFLAGSVREDPATGSAAACLGGYLLAHGTHGERFTLRLAQGGAIARPSRLRLDVTGPAAAAKIRVGGRVLESARGELL